MSRPLTLLIGLLLLLGGPVFPVQHPSALADPGSEASGSSSGAGAARGSAGASGSQPATGSQANTGSQAGIGASSAAMASTPGASSGISEAQFKQLMQLILRQHVDSSLTEAQLFQAAAEGMLQRVSPELPASTRSKDSPRPSNLLMFPSEGYRWLKLQQGMFVGIGFWIDVHKEQGVLEVLRTMNNSPAARAGIQAGDRIVEVDGTSVAELLRTGGVFRADVGIAQRVVVLRKHQRLQFSLAREEFLFEAVLAEMLPDQVALLEFHVLHEQSPSQTRDALLKLKARNPRGLVLDLRNSIGYSPKVLVELLELFVPKDRAMIQLEERGGARRIIKGARAPILQVPMAVIVDRMTSGTAEALASGLVEGARASLVGENSAGRATIEQILKLDDQLSVSVSTQRLLSASGSSWQSVGLRPAFLSSIPDAARNDALRAQSMDERLQLDVPLRTAINLLKR